ncbi:MAG: hypothetical protein AAGE98_22085 [Actinomycetota bacterium]
MSATVFTASAASRRMIVAAMAGCLALAVYALGAGLDWWGGRVCYRSCETGDTEWFWLVVAAIAIFGTGALVVGGRQLFGDRTEMDADGIATTVAGSNAIRLEWGSIERFDVIGRPGFPAQVHAVTVDGSVRLRGISVAAEGGQGDSVAELRATVERLAGRSIPVEQTI